MQFLKTVLKNLWRKPQYIMRTPSGDGLLCDLETITASEICDGGYTKPISFHFVKTVTGKRVRLTQDQFNLLVPDQDSEEMSPA